MPKPLCPVTPYIHFSCSSCHIVTSYEDNYRCCSLCIAYCSKCWGFNLTTGCQNLQTPPTLLSKWQLPLLLDHTAAKGLTLARSSTNLPTQLHACVRLLLPIYQSPTQLRIPTTAVKFYVANKVANTATNISKTVNAMTPPTHVLLT